jgi:hypothetical protein
MPVGSGDFQDEGDESDNRDAIPTISRQRLPATALKRFDLGSSDLDGYDCKDCNDADVHAHLQKEASQADDGSTQNVKD